MKITPKPTKKTLNNTMQIIYIMGSGHSGSTLLDIILGNHSDIVSVGELTNLVRDAWVDNKHCACGKTGNECPFWSAVRIHWEDSIGSKNIEKYLVLQSNFERFHRLPFLIRNRFLGSGTLIFQRYAEHTYELFKAISKVSGKKNIVDSSKSPIRALSLSMMPSIDLRLVHLVRDGRGVVWSLMKKGLKGKSIRSKRIYTSPWLASFEWLLNNTASGFVLNKTDLQGIRIRYEDFVEQPKKVLRNIGRSLGIGLEPVIDNILSGREMKIGHNIAGNRVRMAGSIHIRPDYEWKERSPKKDQRTFWLLAGRLAKTYGYSWN